MWRYPKGVGCPIRTSTDQSLLAAPRGFSQRATSFIASWCQGIHRMPLSYSDPVASCQASVVRNHRARNRHIRFGFDIDRLVSRTLSYALLTGLLVGIYAGLVLLTTQVLQFSSPVAVAVSTLIAAALFAPLRRWLQRLVDRRFNRARYDADRTVAAFAARLQDAVDLDAVQADLATAVQQTLEPAHISVWINERR